MGLPNLSVKPEVFLPPTKLYGMLRKLRVQIGNNQMYLKGTLMLIGSLIQMRVNPQDLFFVAVLLLRSHSSRHVKIIRLIFTLSGGIVI